jgi:hypothetical protein
MRWWQPLQCVQSFSLESSSYKTLRTNNKCEDITDIKKKDYSDKVILNPNSLRIVWSFVNRRDQLKADDLSGTHKVRTARQFLVAVVERDHLGDLDIDGTIILTLMLNKVWGSELDSTGRLLWTL